MRHPSIPLKTKFRAGVIVENSQQVHPGLFFLDFANGMNPLAVSVSPGP